MHKFKYLLIILFTSPLLLKGQEIEFQKFSISYSLPPTVGDPLTVSEGLTNFQFRVFGNNSFAIPEENLPNKLAQEEPYYFIKGWKQVRKNPQFFLDFYFDQPTISLEKIVDKERPYASEAPYSEKVLLFNFRMNAKCKAVKLDGTVLYEFSFPDEDLEYEFNETKASQLGYKSITGVGFQNEVALSEAAELYRNQILEKLELWAANYYMTGSRAGKNNLHNEIYFQMFPYDGKDVFELALFDKLEGTALEQFDLIKANSLAKEYYIDIQSNMMHYQNSEKIIKAIKIWTKAFSHINSLDMLPPNKELSDALAYNMAVGLSYLNNYETAEVAIKTLNTDHDYGIGIGKSNRQAKMIERCRYHLDSFIPKKRYITKIRGWEKIEL